MTLKEALRYPVYEKVIVKKGNIVLSINCIDYSDPKKTGHLSHVSFLLSDDRWYGYKELAKVF